MLLFSTKEQEEIVMFDKVIAFIAPPFVPELYKKVLFERYKVLISKLMAPPLSETEPL